jgi:rare lipoprotein A
MKSRFWAFGLLLFLAYAGLAPFRLAAQLSQEFPHESPARKPQKMQGEPERGYAAFYSQSLEGHKTACGETYSSSKLTAAHPKLPCGTKLRVTNLRNGKTVRVTVNDHGPSSPDRIIDLSYAAARALNFTRQGITLVKVEVLH